jgi:hypothetical protein
MKEYADIQYIVSYCEGHPIYETMTAQEQRDIENAGLTVSEIIYSNIGSFRDWQADC